MAHRLRPTRLGAIFVIALAVLGLAVGGVIAAATPPGYRAAALVMVTATGSGEVRDLAAGADYVRGETATWAALVRTPTVLDSVITELDLGVSSNSLAQDVEATVVDGTTAIEISVTRPVAADAARIANAITRSFRHELDAMLTAGQAESSPVDIALVRSASVPRLPVSPDVTLDVALGGGIGLLLGLIVAVIVGAADTRVRDLAGIRRSSSAPVIGRIPAERFAEDRPVVFPEPGVGLRAEAYRTLRTNLQVLDRDGVARTFVVTSTGRGEGRTSTVANLGLALAHAGSRVIVIDGDLRTPRLGALFGVDGPGLSDVLIGRADLAGAVRSRGTPPLDVLPAGTRPPNPTELLGSQAMVELLETLDADYDAILVDAPALVATADAAVLSRICASTILLVAADRSRAGALDASVQALVDGGAAVSGLVVTFVPPSRSGAARFGTLFPAAG